LGKIYNITLKLAKSTSAINLFINNLQQNHQQILAKSTIYKKGKPTPHLSVKGGGFVKFTLQKGQI
jgi:hypothetical protein